MGTLKVNEKPSSLYEVAQHGILVLNSPQIHNNLLTNREIREYHHRYTRIETKKLNTNENGDKC